MVNLAFFTSVCVCMLTLLGLINVKETKIKRLSFYPCAGDVVGKSEMKMWVLLD